MATPFVRFPGLAGNNVSTDDVNGWIDADTAHLEQSVGLWIASVGLDVSPFQSTAITPVYGSFHGETSPSAGVSESRVSAGAPTTTVVVNPSTEYTFSMELSSDQSDTQGRVRVQWFDAGGGFIANSPFPAWVDLGQNTFTRVFSTATSPSNAAYMVILGTWQPTAGTFDTSDRLYFDAICVVTGTSSVFVPSLRIVGSSFVTEEASVTPVTYTYTPGSPLVLGDGYAGNVSQWALHDGVDAAAPIVAQMLATDALRALPL